MYTLLGLHVFNMLVHTFIYSPKDKPAALEAEQDDDFFDED